MNKPVNLPLIKNITISGRIGSGQTTLATRLAEVLQWTLLEGGEIEVFLWLQLPLGIMMKKAFELEYCLWL